MTIFRYLSRELLLTQCAVSAVLLAIVMSGRFIKYLALAAQGLLDPGALFLLLLYRMPGFLQLILPLGFFLAILLFFGRLYLDSEVTVLRAAGISPQRLLGYSLVPAALIALVVAWLSLWLAPWGMAEMERLLNQQGAIASFQTLVPGRFQSMRDGSRVTYVEGVSGERGELSQVFIGERPSAQAENGAAGRGASLLVASRGRQETQADGNRYLILQDGYRYDGTPGRADYRVMRYDLYGVLLSMPEASGEISEREAIPTRHLFGSTVPKYKSELQWRLSIPLLVFVVTLLALPLAKVNPRQGRFLRLLPAVLLYMAYLTLLSAARGALARGDIPPLLGLWWVHGLFLLIALSLVYGESIGLKWASLRSGRRGAGHA